MFHIGKPLRDLKAQALICATKYNQEEMIIYRDYTSLVLQRFYQSFKTITLLSI